MLLVVQQEGHPAYKNWVVRYWRGCLSGVRCKWFAYGQADATATPSSLATVKSEWFTFLVPAYPGCPGNRPLNGCSGGSNSWWMKNGWGPVCTIDNPGYQWEGHVAILAMLEFFISPVTAWQRAAGCCQFIRTWIRYRWQTRAMFCITANVLQTNNVDAECDKLATELSYWRFAPKVANF